eukprot:TRINITY_DN632_c3_g1_i1.p1 TRINITY_DN632_c3_g1~~TRINITY_DN632_c3_g1_i1.p1  ORF type:complete len:3134 (+),score=549.00 TRINITY_DN632_c3_g1_i1:175-9576(+)
MPHEVAGRRATLARAFLAALATCLPDAVLSTCSPAENELECSCSGVAGPLPSDVTLRIIVNDTNTTVLEAAAAKETLRLYAGQVYRNVSLLLAGNDSFFNVTDARLKAVPNGTTEEEADQGACLLASNTVGAAAVSDAFGGLYGSSTSSEQCSGELHAGQLQFQMGGAYQFCYSDNGLYDGASHADVVDPTLEVYGIFSNCTGLDCLATTAFKCYASKYNAAPAGNCVATWNLPGVGVHPSDVGKVSWSAAYTPSWDDATGQLLADGRQRCGTAPDSQIMCIGDAPNCSVDTSGASFSSAANGSTEFTALQELTSVTAGYAFAACYCPGLNGCDDYGDFVQQFGTIYVYATKLCDPLLGAAVCASMPGLTGVAPRHAFALMVHCPPGGCSAAAGSRVRLVAPQGDNDLPASSEQSGCRTAVQSSVQASPQNCDAATPQLCELDGGSRQDWKYFGDDSSNGFRMALQGFEYDALHFHNSVSLDVCFCLGSCEVAANWFKVGSMVHSPYLLKNMGAHQATTVGVPGTVALFKAQADRDSLGLANTSIIKLLPEPALNAALPGAMSELSDHVCATARFDRFGVPALTAATAKSDFSGSDLITNESLVFNNGGLDNLLTFRRAGVYGICYCRFIDCAEISSSWVLTGRFLIRGPAQIHDWTFSTGLTARLEYSGFGLSNSDTLRIVPDYFKCTDGDNNPFSEGTVRIGCPTCQELKAEGMNLTTKILAHDSVACDSQHRGCRTVYIQSVRVLGASSSEILFNGNPTLKTGDRIVLGDEVTCAANCGDEDLAAIKGVHHYGGSGGTHVVGVRVVATDKAFRVQIPFGWSSSVDETAPTFQVTGGQGTWRRISAASTKEEIYGTAAKSSLKVCWGSGGPGTYVGQAGTLNFVQPPQIPSQVSLTALAPDTEAPVLVSFTTSDSTRYNQANGGPEIRLVFPDKALFEARLADAGELTQGLWREDQSQTACGRLFLEMWAPADRGGFPLPRGCRYRLLGEKMELGVLFDAGRGPRPATDYQIVLNAIAKSDLLGMTGETVLRVLTMENSIANPYAALEEGQAAFTRPLLRPGDETSPQLKVPDGLFVLGSDDLKHELRGELSLRLRVAGDALGKITPRTILRVYLFPLTQWDTSVVGSTGTSCQVTCIPDERMGCGPPECSLESLAQPTALQTPSKEYQNNVLRISLSSEMDPIDDRVSHELLVEGLTLPAGGFFPTRLGGQVTTSRDELPHFIMSSGSYIWKNAEANGGYIAQLIVREGDGNARPFKGDAGNVLHIMLALGALLRAPATQALVKQASLRIQWPVNYVFEKLQRTPGTVSDDATGLAAFGDQGLPLMNAGHLPLAQWNCDSAGCTYTLRPGEMIPAGTNIFQSIVVRNPAEALGRDDPANLWTVQLTAPGSAPATFAASPSTFRTSAGFPESTAAGSVSVLGKLSMASLQPSDFTASTSRRPVRQELYVFFKTEHASGPGGSSLLLMAPPAYDFGDPCSCGDLEDFYYASSGTSWTWPLPGVSSCTTNISGVSLQHRAHISLSGKFVQSRTYAFKIMVLNPAAYSTGDHTGWRLETLTDLGAPIDGSPETLGLNPGLSDSWGVYQERMVFKETVSPQLGIQLGPMKPYSLSGQDTLITVLPIRTFEDLVATTLRVSAPSGFIWSFAEADFVYRSPVTAAVGTPTVAGTTADLPGGVPNKDSNLLLWTAADYAGTKIYGFSTSIRIPDRTTTHSSNAFFLEFGYTDRSSTGSQRSLAVRMEGPVVMALTRAAVTLKTDVRAVSNTATITIETATEIPNGGALTISTPAGFVFAESCLTKAVRDREENVLPGGVTCGFVSGSNPFTMPGELQLKAGPGGIPAKLYVFQLDCENPASQVRVRPDAGKPCGYSECWTFKSLLSSDASTELDLGMSVPSYSIFDLLPYAAFSLLEAPALVLLGQDNRPLHSNVISISFRLRRDVLDITDVVLTGPFGIVFAEDCLANQGVVTQLRQLLGTLLLKPPPMVSEAADDVALSAAADYELAQAIDYNLPWWASAWEKDVPAMSCKGDGRVASLKMGVGLLKETLYAFAIRVHANPEHTPGDNKWTLRVGAETSLPFDGYPLWTFSDAVVDPGSTAAMTTAERTSNLVNVTFRPYHAVQAGGWLLLTAPENFSFPTETKNCPVVLEEKDPISPEPDDWFPFPDGDISCIIPSADEGQDPTDSLQALRLKLTGGRQIVTGRTYKLVVRAYNPMAATATGAPPPSWKLESYGITTGSSPESSAKLLDVASVPAPPITPPVGLWSYVNQNDGLGNGRMPVRDLILKVSFLQPLQLEDTIVVTAPFGYDLEDPENRPEETRCNNQRWLPAGESPITERSLVVCDKRELRVTVREEKIIAADALLQLQIDTKNPALNPPLSWDYWKVEHRDAAGKLQSSGIFSGWKVVSLLEDTKAELVGPSLAAGSYSDIQISFTAVSAATSLSIEAKEPLGFDFAKSTIESEGHTLLDAVSAVIRIGINIEAGKKYTVYIRFVLLGRKGGATRFDFATYNEDNEVVDRKRDVTGFRLPGSIQVVRAALQNGYKLAPQLFPVRSRWRVPFSSAAEAVFTLTFTNVAAAGEVLRIIGAPYALDWKGLSLTSLSTNASVPMRVTFAAAGEVYALLLETILPETQYQLKVSVTTPSSLPLPEGGSRWSFATDDGGLLPTSHANLTLTDGFQLVSSFAFSVQALRQPPLTEIEVVLSLGLGAAQPTVLTVVAPEGFAFKKDCLVRADSATPLVEACEPGPLLEGRPTAKLTCPAGGCSGTLPFLNLKVTTSKATPADRTWLIEGIDDVSGEQLGWGQDVEGLEVEQMQDVAIVYPGISAYEGVMAVKFRTSDKVQPGGRVQLAHVPDYDLRCLGAHLREMSLPGVLECAKTSTSITLTLNGTLSQGVYAFAVTAKLPMATPSDNTFSLLVMDRNGKVQDAAVGVAGIDIGPSLGVDPLPLQWTSAEAGGVSTVTMGFAVQKMIARYAAGAVLITFPEYFTHAVERASNVVISNEKLPLMSKGGIEDGWLNISTVDRIILNLNSGQPVLGGEYRVTFPVTVPERTPPFNVWQLTICKARTEDRPIEQYCRSPQGTDVMVSFPLSGFTIGENARVGGRGEDSAAGSVSGAEQRLPWQLLYVPLMMFAVAIA